MRTWWIFFALFPLSACLGFGAACEEVHVPLPSGGSRYTYEGHGAWTAPANLMLADMSAFGGERGTQPLRLDGLRLVVAFADEGREALSSDGSLTPSLQVSYWAVDSTGATAQALGDERISTLDGSTIQVILRQSGGGLGEGFAHQVVFMREERPSAVFAALLWDRTWRDGDVVSHTPAPVEYRGIPGLNITYTLKVVRVSHAEPCRMTVDFEYETGSSKGSQQFVFEHGNAMYVEQRGPDFPNEDQEATSHQVARIEGNGPRPSPFAPQDQAGTAMSMVPWKQVVQGVCCGFATDLATAMEVAREDEAAEAWFQQHPEARVVRFEHRLGAEDSRTIDVWSLDWSDGRAGLETIVYRMDPLIPVDPVDPPFRVSTDLSEAYPLPPSDALVVSLPELGRLSRLHFGIAPEIIACSLDSGHCDVGTHASTGAMRQEYQGVYAEVSKPSLVVNVTSGRLLQDNGLNGIGLPEPVPWQTPSH